PPARQHAVVGDVPADGLDRPRPGRTRAWSCQAFASSAGSSATGVVPCSGAVVGAFGAARRDLRDRSRVPNPFVTRSRIIAMTTTAVPASKPSGMLTELNAWTMGRPRPGAPTMLAMTDIESESMMTWLIPAMMDGIARG